MLLNTNLGMSHTYIKQVICHGLGWNHNDIEIDITWRCHVEEHQYYLILISCEVSFRTIIDLFVQSGSNII
jgi:hypothetical protein